MKRMPNVPIVTPLPSMRMFRRTTLRLVPEVMFTTMPGTPEWSVLASVPLPSRVIGLVIVTEPNPPGSSASMMPPLAVFEIAPAHVLHGAVRLQGFTSSPTPETHVRVACACAAVEKPITRTVVPRNRRILEVVIWIVGWFEGWIARHLREALRLCNLPGGRQAN